MNTPYIQVQVASPTAQGTIINPGTNIMWDTVLTKSEDVSLDMTRGIIQLSKPGVYHAEWHISAGGAQQTAPFVLTLDTTEAYSIAGAAMGAPGEISGSAIFIVHSAGSVSLINKTSPITFGTGSVMANLVIYMLADNTGSSTAENDSGSCDADCIRNYVRKYHNKMIPFSMGFLCMAALWSLTRKRRV